LTITPPSEGARALLEAEGFEVVGEAADGRSAIDAARSLNPEIVLLDVQLPDLEGFEVARLLMEEDRSLTVILVSSRDADDYGDRLTDGPAKGFISKGDLTAAKITALAERS